MRAIRIAVFLGAISATSVALSQTVDFSISITRAGIPVAGREMGYSLNVNAYPRPAGNVPFVVRVIVPPELESISTGCFNDFASDINYDAATRILTWTDSLNGPDFGFRYCTVTFRIAPSLAPQTTFQLKATIASSTPDPNPLNDTTTLTESVLASSDLSVKTSADVLRFRPGATITYTFSVTNLGPQDAHGVVLVDQLSPSVSFVSFQQTGGPPASVDASPHDGGSLGCYEPRCGNYIEARIGDVPNGGNATFRLVVNAGSSFEAANISNRAFVQSSSPDQFTNNNDFDYWTYAGPNADLTLTSNWAPDAPGLRIPVTITVSNDGPDTVNSVMVHDILLGDGNYFFVDNVKFLSATPSQGTCSPPAIDQFIGSPNPPAFWTLDCALGTLASGARATITVVIERKPLSGKFTHTSYVSPAQNDPNAANNQSQLSFPLIPRNRAVKR